MVEYSMIIYISECWKQSQQNRSIFGKISVLAVGDFYHIQPVGDLALNNSDKGSIYETLWAAM